MNKLSNNLSAKYTHYRKKLNKRTRQSVALALSTALLITGAYMDQPTKITTDVEPQPASTAGVFAAVSAMEVSVSSSNFDYASADVTVVAATSDQVDPDKADIYDEWADKIVANVDEFLYVRSEADIASEVVAKLRKGDVATLVDVFDGWYEIESGNAHGYVSADYCATGIEAYELALDACDTYATIDVNGLRVRDEASEDAKIVTAVSKGTKLEVDTEAEEVDGWVAVKYGNKKGYVKSDYVEVDLATGEAITLEEEAEAIKAAEEAAAKAAAEKAAQKEAAKAAAAQTASAKQSVIASADDLTLLAAIIQIEAGSELYEGQVAVGAVVMNRVVSGSYANTIEGVIFQKGQFSTSRMSRVVAAGPKASCVQAAQEALAGADPTGGLTHFRRAGSKSGYIIGNHVFY